MTVDPPRPLLSSRAEAALGPRHRAALDQLEDLFLAEGIGFTVRELAARLRCSLRTLYEIAPSKQELMLVVLDRFLHRVGRTALAAIDPAAPVSGRLRAYFTAAAELQRWTVALAAPDEPEVQRLLDRHFAYVSAVVESLVAEGVAGGEMREADPSVVAAVLSGAAEHLVRAGTLRPMEDVIGDLIDVVLFGIQA